MGSYKNRQERVLLKEYVGNVTAIHKNNIDTKSLNESINVNKYLTEAERRGVAENDDLFLVGIIQAADTKNGNGRVYPRQILEKEVNRFKKEVIANNGGYGHNQHPDSEDIDIREISHRMVDIWFEGNNVMGKIRVLHNTPGNELRSLIELDGMNPGISSRAVGSIHEDYNGTTVVEEDLHIICWDTVVTPSTPSAFMMQEREVRMHESKSMGGNRREKIKTLLEDMTRG